MIEVKESYPVQLAEYAKLHHLEDEPAFVWWITRALRKRDQIISSVKVRVKNRTRKYGIMVPVTVKEAFDLDRQNGNSQLKDAIQKEMKNFMFAFKVLDFSEKAPVGYSRLRVHMVFDIKLDLTRKAHLVADGHLTHDPVDSMYVGVLSRETARIALTYAAFHGWDLWATDGMNVLCKHQRLRNIGSSVIQSL